jgi:Tol biopolymer transport system component
MVRWWLRTSITGIMLFCVLCLFAWLWGHSRTNEVLVYSSTSVQQENITSEIRLFDIRTHQTYTLTYGQEISYFSVTADSASIIYGQAGQMRRYDIWLHDADEAQTIRLFDNAISLVSPDGAWIAAQPVYTGILNENDGFAVIDSRGQTHHRINLRAAAWSPDSSRLTYAILGVQSVTLNWLDMATGTITPFAQVSGTVHYMDWSPDGTRLLLGDSFNLRQYDAVTHEVSILYEQQGEKVIAPQWSADGQRILWLTGNPTNGYHVVIADAQGTILNTIVVEGLANLNRADWWHYRNNP